MSTSAKPKSQVFHPGEITQQDRVGLEDERRLRLESLIRDYLPEQHRIFVSRQPYLFNSWEHWIRMKIFRPRSHMAPMVLYKVPTINPYKPIKKDQSSVKTYYSCN